MELSEAIEIYDGEFTEAKKVVAARAAEMTARARTKTFLEIRDELELFNSEITETLLAPGQKLMQSDAFRAATFEQQMGLTRWRTATASSVGYETMSTIQSVVLLKQFRENGIIRKPRVLTVAKSKVEESIGMVAEHLTTGDIDKATIAYRESQASTIKQSQVETIQKAVEGSRKRLVEARRELGAKDSCTYCSSRAGYWTTDIGSISHFHNDCKCTIVTRAII